MGLSIPYPPFRENSLMVDEDGHQYIEIGYYFAHLMLRAQALKLLEEAGGGGGRQTPVDGSPAARTPTDFSSHELKKSHMSAISQLSTQILNRARRVEVAEMRVSRLLGIADGSTLRISFILLLHLRVSHYVVSSPLFQFLEQ